MIMSPVETILKPLSFTLPPFLIHIGFTSTKLDIALCYQLNSYIFKCYCYKQIRYKILNMLNFNYLKF